MYLTIIFVIVIVIILLYKYSYKNCYQGYLVSSNTFPLKYVFPKMYMSLAFTYL